MITTLTLNPAIDLYAELEHLQLDQVNRVPHAVTLAGGKGVNVATVIKQLGMAVCATGFLGEDNIQVFSKHFNALNIKERFIRIAGATRQNIKVIDSKQQVTEINFAGFTVSALAFEQLNEQLLKPLSENKQTLVVAGSLPNGINITQFKALLSMLKDSGAELVVDSSGDCLKAAISVSPYLIKPNIHELEEYFSQRFIVDEQLQEEALKQSVYTLIKQGISEVLLSLGERGLIWFSQTKIVKISVPKVQVVSTVGAGDTLLAAYLWAREQNTPQLVNTEDKLKFAAALACFKVTQQQLLEVDINQVQQLIEQITVERCTW